MGISRRPGESPHPCFRKELNLNVFSWCLRRTAPHQLGDGSRPAPGWRDMRLRAGLLGSSHRTAEAGVEHVADAVAQQVERQHGDGDREPWEQH